MLIFTNSCNFDVFFLQDVDAMTLRLCKLFLPWRKTTERCEFATVSVADIARNLNDILTELESDGGTSPRVSGNPI